MKMCVCAAALMVAAGSSLAGVGSTDMRITEWMYSGLSGEFIEFTNVGSSPIDMTGWSFDDDSTLPGVIDLSSYGVVQPGESVILTELLASEFSANWALPASVKVIGGNVANLGRNDTINLFSGTTLIDRLVFGDQNILGTIRTQNISGITLPSNLGTNNVAGWFFSSVGDAYGSRASALGDVANPGVAAIPTPGVLALVGAGAVMALRRRR